jgi:hypothetical protein
MEALYSAHVLTSIRWQIQKEMQGYESLNLYPLFLWIFALSSFEAETPAQTTIRLSKLSFEYTG